MYGQSNIDNIFPQSVLTTVKVLYLRHGSNNNLFFYLIIQRYLLPFRCPTTKITLIECVYRWEMIKAHYCVIK